jgi:hypothetical protein
MLRLLYGFQSACYEIGRSARQCAGTRFRLHPTTGSFPDPRILNAIPLPVLLLDQDGRVMDLNDSASQLCGVSRKKLKGRRSGYVLKCAHTADVPEGCGEGPACQGCVLRGSMLSSMRGTAVRRQRASFEMVHGHTHRELQLLVSASPLQNGETGQTLLVLEDVSDMVKLTSLVPICMKCKSVRQDEEYWQSVEGYLRQQMGMEFSHGLCPTCMETYYPTMLRKQA